MYVSIKIWKPLPDLHVVKGLADTFASASKHRLIIQKGCQAPYEIYQALPQNVDSPVSRQNKSGHIEPFETKGNIVQKGVERGFLTSDS